MRKLLIVSVLFFAVLSVIFLISWRLTTNSTDQESWFLQFNWYTLGFTFCLGATLLSFGLPHIRLSGRGLPSEYLPKGKFPAIEIPLVRGPFEKSYPKGHILFLIQTSPKDPPKYISVDRLDMSTHDDSGDTLIISYQKGHDRRNRKVELRLVDFVKKEHA